MSLKELWELFPVILKTHNPQYQERYRLEKKNILSCVEAADIVRINHIGSTAVTGLLAKPTIDILLEISGECNVTQLTDALISNGWTLMHQENKPVWKLVFNKGYTPDGFAEKVYHLHVRYHGDWDELYFRDYLIANPEIADKYGALKSMLMDKYRNDRDGYTAAKSDFITEHSGKAKEQFAGRYKPGAEIRRL